MKTEAEVAEGIRTLELSSSPNHQEMEQLREELANAQNQKYALLKHIAHIEGNILKKDKIISKAK
jgi:hypothetical protein